MRRVSLSPLGEGANPLYQEGDAIRTYTYGILCWSQCDREGAVIIAAIHGQYRRRRCGYYLALRMLYTVLLSMGIVEYLRSQGAIQGCCRWLLQL